MNMEKRKTPLVSVVMVVLNPQPSFFLQAVQSILDQTFSDFELIIVEDPSPRIGKEQLKEMADPRIRYFLNSHRTSLVEQRNKGLAEARGKFLAVLDADDVAEPTRLEKQVDFLLTHPDVGVVGSQVCVIDKDNQVKGHRSFLLQHEDICAALTSIVAVCHGSAMYRKADVVEAGGYKYSEHNTAEDYDLLTRLALRGIRFANLPEFLLYYRFHPEQAKARRLHSTIRGVLEVKKRYWRNRMGFFARWRMYGEQFLLCLPAWLVYRLLFLIQYNGNSSELKKSAKEMALQRIKAEENLLEGIAP